MNIHKRILNLSAWLAALAIFVIPGTVYTEDGPLRTEYGFPLRFFTDYHYAKPDDTIWFFSTASINILEYLLNVLIIYNVILFIKKRADRSKRVDRF
ncbi:hypothetical protein C0Q44_11055 [Paenibacillus sp. PCH8]|uniref:hypothetical protein n=1 Tax=Paenibacillus sp. PCH8 TaxID=2066524 RepID=UPI000CF9F490|nr:hypothetical protein [Paenibacillus sp. PCH8]PQP85004.1 hypothetical protein C0Q44_11055 [Paenibacillus sp. PCH8]